ncbi:hypothetical protein [Archangium primigenium]|uniref:hypothetical protein n=1 Tax=[Archangium] primigenium TaxID=2792470 RepID=UPI00195D9D7C|nr:hypothetical protein [Archangium primigenium]MBM7118370.1 hypothetical protein [Archangium primigenium]
MPLAPSAEELISVVQNYYDSNNNFHFRLETSPETSRRQALWTQWIAHMDPWLAFRDELGSKLPEHVIGETYSSHDGGPRCIIYPPDDLRTHSSDWTVVGCLSLLAPVYFIYGLERERQTKVRRYKVSFETPPPHMSLPAKIIARTIETSFGASSIPRAVADTPVQLFVGNLAPLKTTLFHALFTDEPETIP